MISTRTGTHDAIGTRAHGNVDYGALDQPAVMRRRRDATIEGDAASRGVEVLDIPAFFAQAGGLGFRRRKGRKASVASSGGVVARPHGVSGKRC